MRIPRIHIFVVGEFISKLSSGLQHTRVDGLWITRKTDRIDSVEAVDGRIELATGVVVIGRCSPSFVLYGI